MRTLSLIAVLSVCAFGAWGCGGDDDGSAGDSGASEERSGGAYAPPSEEGKAEPGAQTLRLSADPGGALAFDKDSLTAKAGEVTIVMDNPSDLPHAVALTGGGVDESGETIGNGGVSRVSATVEAGEYEYVCPVSGHAEGGMTGTLTVE